MDADVFHKAGVPTVPGGESRKMDLLSSLETSASQCTLHNDSQREGCVRQEQRGEQKDEIVVQMLFIVANE